MKIRNIRWDPAKAELNWRKHQVHFEEAETIFHDPLISSIEDLEHSHQEDRFLGIGMSRNDRVLTLIYTIRQDEAWLISAREAMPAERRRYMKGDRIRDAVALSAVDDFPEVDFTNAVRGLHWIPMGIVRVSIDEDVAKYYADDASVNAALRMLIAEGRAAEPRNE